MKRLLFAGVAAFTVSLNAQGTVKIGLIMPCLLYTSRCV